MNRRKLGIIILSVFLPLALADSLTTNWLISHGASEANPLMAGIAGTPWLVIFKVGWILLFLAVFLIGNEYRLNKPVRLPFATANR